MNSSKRSFNSLNLIKKNLQDNSIQSDDEKLFVQSRTKDRIIVLSMVTRLNATVTSLSSGAHSHELLRI